MIETNVVEQIATDVVQRGVNDDTISHLRQAYQGIHFTYCSDDDVTNGSPVLEKDGFNIYLVDGNSHCLSMTSSYERATGIVVAEVYPEED